MNDVRRFQRLQPDQLPTLPGTAVRLLELSQSPDATVQELCDAIRSDPAIAARVVKIANSPYYGLRSEVTTIDKAALLLGPSVLTSITLTFYLAQDSISDKSLAEHFQAFWLRVIVQATAAETILSYTHTVGKNSAFLAGLLCDVGQLAMLKVDAAAHARLVQRANETATSLLQLEPEAFGTDHIEVGMVLAERWHFPKVVRDAIQFHHNRPASFADLPHLHDWNTIRAVVAGSAVAEHLCGGGEGGSWHNLRECCSSLFELKDHQIIEFLERVHAGVRELSSFFDFDVRTLPEPAQLLADAQEQLDKCELAAHTEIRQGFYNQYRLQLQNEKLEREKEDLENRVIKDQLTGAYSRSFFEECLRKEARSCSRANLPIAVAFCDINHFKEINDKFGHQYGDQVLRHVADVLRSTLRESDVLARYGGEEFVVILPGQDPEQVDCVTERMRKAVQDLTLYHQQQRVRVSISVGACILLPGDRPVGDLSDRLVVEADKAMYCAKRSGRNQTRTQVLEHAPHPCAAAKPFPH